MIYGRGAEKGVEMGQKVPGTPPSRQPSGEMLRASVSPEELGKALVPKLGDGQTFGGINKKKCVSVQKGWVSEKTHKHPQNPTFHVLSHSKEKWK